MTSIGNTKAPSMDNFNAFFFKSSWLIVRKDVTDTIKEYFQKRYIYKAFNFSLVTLTPKTSSVYTIRYMRPNSYYSTFYKILYKILITRLGEVINEIIDDSQTDF